jgi:hypothetical protein
MWRLEEERLAKKQFKMKLVAELCRPGRTVQREKPSSGHSLAGLPNFPHIAKWSGSQRQE